MTATLLAPDVRRILADYERRIQILERRVNPVAASSGETDHDGTGARSTVVNLSAASPTASGIDATAIGAGASAAGNYSVAAGADAAASDTSTVALGDFAIASELNAIAIGASSTADYTEAIALGSGISATGEAQMNTGRNRLFCGAPTTAPADATLITNQFTIWVDQAANLLTFKVKYGTGTIKTGTVALV